MRAVYSIGEVKWTYGKYAHPIDEWIDKITIVRDQLFRDRTPAGKVAEAGAGPDLDLAKVVDIADQGRKRSPESNGLGNPLIDDQRTGTIKPVTRSILKMTGLKY